MDIIVGIQGGLVQRGCLGALDDFLAGEGENRLEELLALLFVRRRQNEEHPGAVLDVARRK